MNPATIALIVVAILLLIPVIYALVIYNRFVSLKQHLKDSWHGIQVELQRRYDLIPNLVETAKGYAALGAALGKLFAVAEGYPDLKADELFLNLQNELANTEDRIAATRRFYNGNCRELNTLAQQFPSKLVAGLAGVEHADYFDVPDDAIRTAPKVSLAGG
ncbi:MAG: LemA family protein [Phycisphaerales bacterium]